MVHNCVSSLAIALVLFLVIVTFWGTMPICHQ